MVRRNLILWIGLAAFAGLVAALVLIALNRESGVALHGHWRLELVDTPEGSFVPEIDGEWIQFDDGSFRGRTECYDFDGEYISTEPGQFLLDGWGTTTLCVNVERNTSYAFDQYFGEVTRYEFDVGGLTLENDNASVQFSFMTEGG